MLAINTKAPEFSLVDDTGTTRSLSEFLGKRVVLYFYPKDDTPGCTKEACMLRDAYDDFAKADVVVIGVSADSPASHKEFKAKYGLPFILLADEKKETIKAYEAKGLLMSKRITYIIGEDGLIKQAYPDVDPATHAGMILKDLGI
jgi:peroxiredoxin Q/BCP